VVGGSQDYALGPDQSRKKRGAQRTSSDPEVCSGHELDWARLETHWGGKEKVLTMGHRRKFKTAGDSMRRRLTKSIDRATMVRTITRRCRESQRTYKGPRDKGKKKK